MSIVKKVKDFEIAATPLCLGNIPKNWSVDNMKKTELNGYVYDFSVDYDAIPVDDILDIHNYLMKKKTYYNKMLRFIRSCFFTGLVFLLTLTGINSLSCISMNNQECKVRPQIVNLNRGELVFFPFSIKTSKCNGSCNNIENPYTKLCVPDVDENLNVKVFNLVSRTNETRHIEWHETCKCKSWLDASICNNKQRWNDDKCRCECKELFDNGAYDRGLILNPSSF